MIKVRCPNAACGKLAAVKEEFAGKRAQCPACGTIMPIPTLQAASAAHEVPQDTAGGPPAKSAIVSAMAMGSFVAAGLALVLALVLFLHGRDATSWGERIMMIASILGSLWAGAAIAGGL